MKRLEEIRENRAIGNLARQFLRSPYQANSLHESDAELIAIDGDESQLLAITIDTVADEITEGLYRDPFTMGWITVMASFSDLAAVGAEPIGIVTAISLERSRDEAFRRRIAEGMEQACRRIGSFILGGDLNFTPSISLTGCAIGKVSRTMKMARVGCQAGDIVFLSGRAGSGNALGLVCKKNLPEEIYPEKSYRPVARTREALLVRRYASCCMDTSDGLFITIDQLIRLNERGFSIRADWQNILEKDAYRLCETTNVPFWFMAAGIHGEFELLFTVPAPKTPAFLREAHRMDFHPIALGKTTHAPRFAISLETGKKTEIDMSRLRNLWDRSPGNIEHIFEEHIASGKTWGLN